VDGFRPDKARNGLARLGILTLRLSPQGTLMHFYQFNIKDYQSHTGHLDEFEDLAYRRLLDWCYLHERPLPLEPDEIARLIRMRSHSDCIASVLREFFVRTDHGWISDRVLREISSVNNKSEKARESARARWDKRLDANALPTQSEGNAPMTHYPLPITQDPVIQEANASLSGTGFPPCPHGKILELWKTHLPHLSQPRTWEGARQAALRSRWNQASKKSSWSDGYGTTDDGLKWWDSFLSYIASDTKLSNGFESNGRVWHPDLPWILNATNFAKIIDGKYQK
jgi:uncharacterized protein YdaU (DUF1376 family)